jgi:ligand-binding SRPBCC domain-containing protein
MKIYTIKRTVTIPTTLEKAWDFFSSPKNLQVITPAKMNFRIQYDSGTDKMYPGQIIRYKVKVLPLIDTTWVTEITHVVEHSYFIDEQRFGPYALWHHQHHFKSVPGGVEMKDEVNYAIPYGIIGRMANAMFVEREVNGIFDYRTEVISKHFI